MGLKLKKVERIGVTEAHKATYTLTHGNGKTVLELDLALTVDRAGFCADMDVSGPVAATADEALDRLADWLERGAESLRKRKTGNEVRQLPLYEDF